MVTIIKSYSSWNINNTLDNIKASRARLNCNYAFFSFVCRQMLRLFLPHPYKLTVITLLTTTTTARRTIQRENLYILHICNNFISQRAVLCCAALQRTELKLNCLFVRPSVCPTFCPTVYLSLCLSACLPDCLSVCPSICLFVSLSVCLSDCLSACPSDCLFVCAQYKPLTNNQRRELAHFHWHSSTLLLALCPLLAAGRGACYATYLLLHSTAHCEQLQHCRTYIVSAVSLPPFASVRLPVQSFGCMFYCQKRQQTTITTNWLCI